MTAPISRTDLLRELEPVVAASLQRHLGLVRDWMPHDYVPWERGRDFREHPWSPDQSGLPDVAQVAVEVNLLTEDNLPSYHHEIATAFGRDSAWGEWVHRWTAEEGRHALALRDYLLVTRAIDPDALERARMETVSAGFSSGGKEPLRVLAYVAFQELATRISHRNTGRATDDPVAERLLARVAADENLHMVFYRGLVDAALELAPSQTVEAIAAEVLEFAMPGTGIPGFARKAVVIADAGIYDLRVHRDEVLMPVLEHWGWSSLTGLSAEAEQARDAVAAHLEGLDALATRYEERRAARAARRAALV